MIKHGNSARDSALLEASRSSADERLGVAPSARRTRQVEPEQASRSARQGQRARSLPRAKAAPQHARTMRPDKPPAEGLRTSTPASGTPRRDTQHQAGAGARRTPRVDWTQQASTATRSSAHRDSGSGQNVVASRPCSSRCPRHPLRIIVLDPDSDFARIASVPHPAPTPATAGALHAPSPASIRRSRSAQAHSDRHRLPRPAQADRYPRAGTHCSPLNDTTKEHAELTQPFTQPTTGGESECSPLSAPARASCTLARARPHIAGSASGPAGGPLDARLRLRDSEPRVHGQPRLAPPPAGPGADHRGNPERAVAPARTHRPV